MRILLQTAVIALLTGVAAGVAPALYETRRLHTNPLRTIATSDRIRQRWRHALVVFEIAVTIALLVVTATMIDGYWRANRRQMGFRTGPLLTLDVDNRNGVRTRQVVDTLTSIPGVAAASASTQIPTAAGGTRQPVAAQATGGEPVTARHGRDRPGILRDTRRADARGTRVLGSRLERRPHRDRQRSRWPDSSFRTVTPLARASGSRTCRTTSSGSSPTTRAARCMLAYPSRASSCRCRSDSKDVTRMTFLVRAKGDPAALVQTVRNETRKAAAGTVVGGVETVDQVIDIGSREMLVATAPLLPLVTIGMLLTMAGIYGVLAFAIARRSRELARTCSGRRERPRRGPAGHRAHRSSDRGRLDARAGADVRAGAGRARRRRRREHLGPGAAFVRSAGGGGRRGGRPRHVDSVAARAQDRSGRAAAHALN